MNAVNNLLDKYRETCSLPSDSAAAESLHIKRQALHQWRKGIAWPSEDHVIEMAIAIGEAPEKWLVQVSADRASPSARKVWLRLAATGKAAAGIALAILAYKHFGHDGAAEAFFATPFIHYAQLRTDQDAPTPTRRQRSVCTPGTTRHRLAWLYLS
jgi:hypothetical protein